MSIKKELFSTIFILLLLLKKSSLIKLIPVVRVLYPDEPCSWVENPVYRDSFISL